MIRTSIVSALFACALLSACGGGQDPSLTQVPRTDTATEDTTSGSDSAAPPFSTTADNVAWARAATLSQADVEQDRVGETTADTPLSLAPKAVTAPAAPIYRFFNNQTGAHLLTKSVTERDTILNTLPQYRYEGPVFAAWQSTDTGLAPVYRFSNTRTGTHVFTISETERNHIQATMPWMTLEGAAYFAARTALPGTTALYRFYHLQRGFHFYTASISERDHLIANLAGTYRYEGVAYYVNASVGAYGKALAPLAGRANTSGYANGIGDSARFEQIWGMASTSNGDLYAIDSDRYYSHLQPEVRRVSPSGVVTSFVGSRTGSSGHVDGSGSGALFRGLYSITFDPTGTGYVGDYRTIRTISPSGFVTTIAGSKTEGGYINGQAQSARFNHIKGIARDRSGNVFVVDAHVIRKLTPSGVVSTFAGAAPIETVKEGYADGMGTAARFRNPGQMAIDADDNLYVADEGNHRIRKITPAGLVTTLAGQASSGVQDGSGTAARFDNPFAIAVDKATGDVYAADWDGYTVRKITPGGEVSTVVGVAYTPGVFFGSLPAGLNRVGGLAVHGNRLYIAASFGIYWTNLP